MKKILIILLTIIFIIISIFAINILINKFSNEVLLFIVLAFVLFAMHLFAWFAPRVFFNFCWKITKIISDNYDYDTSYSKLGFVDMGILITSILLLGISLLL